MWWKLYSLASLKHWIQLCVHQTSYNQDKQINLAVNHNHLYSLNHIPPLTFYNAHVTSVKHTRLVVIDCVDCVMQMYV